MWVEKCLSQSGRGTGPAGSTEFLCELSISICKGIASRTRGCITPLALRVGRSRLISDILFEISFLYTLGRLGGPRFPRQFVTEKESVTVYLTIDLSLGVAKAKTS